MKRADEGLGFIMKYENVAWYQDGKVQILDRRIYPIRIEYVVCEKHEEVAQAIADMVTQSGGPYTAASMGMVLACYESKDLGEKDRISFLEKAAYTLSHARPTTAAKMERFTGSILSAAVTAIQEGLDVVDVAREKAVQDLNDRYNRFEPVGEIIASLIPKNGTILTQCWAETDIAMTLRACQKRGNEIKVICAETRPYFQGARLTASCAYDMGFDVTVISDNMPGYTMKMKKIDLFTSAADVISCDGYVVNKIGTFQIALAANYWGIPYYATGNPNAAHPTIDTVTIEERDPELTLHAMDIKLTMDGIKGYYPAFDITPPELITGIATIKGLMKPLELARYFD
ncbi:MAG: S-methyl-5-thioribose-1-phosphate isomerase [Clostridia bacterium]|nr:S-methyl-5-thioribose-1-phosphate isomerase [Clostridia bacterium]